MIDPVEQPRREEADDEPAGLMDQPFNDDMLGNIDGEAEQMPEFDEGEQEEGFGFGAADAEFGGDAFPPEDEVETGEVPHVSHASQVCQTLPWLPPSGNMHIPRLSLEAHFRIH